MGILQKEDNTKDCIIENLRLLGWPDDIIKGYLRLEKSNLKLIKGYLEEATQLGWSKEKINKYITKAHVFSYSAANIQFCGQDVEKYIDRALELAEEKKQQSKMRRGTAIEYLILPLHYTIKVFQILVEIINDYFQLTVITAIPTIASLAVMDIPGEYEKQEITQEYVESLTYEELKGIIGGLEVKFPKLVEESSNEQEGPQKQYRM